MFFEVAQINLNVIGTSLKNTPILTRNVVIMIGITGQLKGFININLDEEFAKKIASNMMCGMPVTELDEMSKSAVSELCNMLMGRVCTSFSEQGIVLDITPPNILTGENMQLSVTTVPVISIKFGYEEYEMDFDISVMENL